MLFDWEQGASYAELQEWFRQSMRSQRLSWKRSPALVRPAVRVATFNVQMQSGDVFADVEALQADVIVLNEFWPLPNSHPTISAEKMCSRLERVGYTNHTFHSSPSWQKVTFVTVIFSRIPFAFEKQHMIEGDRHAGNGCCCCLFVAGLMLGLLLYSARCFGGANASIHLGSGMYGGFAFLIGVFRVSRKYDSILMCMMIAGECDCNN